MKSEFYNPIFRKFIFQIVLFSIVTIGIVVFVNFFVDSAQVNSESSYREMARLALAGNIVAVPENYNERVFQVDVVEEMTVIPEIVVIGSSRGMYLGKETTSYRNIYNNCVSGASMEDYYALMGLYQKKFNSLPKYVIIEVSPWVFYDNSPNNRWSENDKYFNACNDFYFLIKREILRKEDEMPYNSDGKDKIKKENPYFSIPYFQYNISIIRTKGIKAFIVEKARISTDESEAADLPDGTIRYIASYERPNPKRLERVKKTDGGVTYKNVNKMTKIGEKQKEDFEYFIKYLKNKNIKIVLFKSPFSATQSMYIYEKNTNPVFKEVEKYLTDVGNKFHIMVIGDYNAEKYHLTDESFIDFMHLDKMGIKMVWESSR